MILDGLMTGHLESWGCVQYALIEWVAIQYHWTADFSKYPYQTPLHEFSIYTWQCRVPAQLGASGQWQIVMLKLVELQPYSADISEEVLEHVTVGSLLPLNGGSGTDAPETEKTSNQ